MQKRSLTGLPEGKTGFLQSVSLPERQRKRLADLGFVPGAAICRCMTAPGGSPVAFDIKGAVIALRRTDCDKITVCYHG